MNFKLATFLLIPIALLVLFILFNRPFQNQEKASNEHTHYHAGFVVYIDGVRQDYSDDEFMNPDICAVSVGNEENPLEKVHLHNNIGDVAHVHKEGVLWRDLFTNLNQEFAQETSVVGYRDGQIVENILDSPILPDDSVIVVVGSDQGIDLSLYVSADRIVEVSSQQELACGEQPNQRQQETAIDTTEPQLIAQNLRVPWEIIRLPDGELIVTERPGNLTFVRSNTRVPVEGVAALGEGGLLGLALDPDFGTNRFIYLYLTTRQNGKLINQVRRYTLSDYAITVPLVILNNIPASSNHNGGRIAFGPDGYLYVATGDASEETLAQDTNSLAGKILRITKEGKPAPDNPFGNEVYSYGHRNVQGLTWDGQGLLWATEHGRSGVQSGLDELNRIEKGGNYGWPIIEGDEKREGMLAPVIHSGTTKTWAPAGLVFSEGKLYFTGLRGQTLYRFDPLIRKLDELHKGEYGRLRALSLGADNSLYISTSNQDGRGEVRQGDDKIIFIPFPIQ